MTVTPHPSQTLAMPPGQMVFMAPHQLSCGVAPFLPSNFYQVSDAEGLGLAQPRAMPFMSEGIAHAPEQVSMDPTLEAPRNAQHENSLNATWNYDPSAWTSGTATMLNSDGQATEQWLQRQQSDSSAWTTSGTAMMFDSEGVATEQWLEQQQVETGNDTDAWGINKSTLRRRRRQRVADRAASDAKSSEEQSFELLAQVRAGGEAQRSAVARFRRLSFGSQDSCRVAQLVLEEASPGEAAAVLKALHGLVREAVQSMFANYVIQRAVEVLPNESTNFVPLELLGVGREVARHRSGCRILCRLLEHGSLEGTSISALLEEVLADTDALSRDTYGNFVIRHCLEFGHPSHQHLIATSLCTNLIETAMDQNGSHVIESAVQFCETADKEAIANLFLVAPEQLQSLATDAYGRHAVKALLRTAGAWQEPVAAALRSSIRALKQSKQGKPVLQALQAFDSKLS
jgi:hypothetical protein